MTAIAHGARSDFAFIAADAGAFGEGGAIMAFKRKLLQLPHLNAVLAWSGIGLDSRPMLEHARKFSKIGHYLEDLPSFAEQVRADLSEHSCMLEGAPMLCIFYLAYFDRRSGTSGAVQVLPEGGRIRAPFMARSVKTGGQPGSVIREFPHLDPKSDLIPFMNAARKVETGTSYPGCAGWVDLARVSAKGISIGRVHRWADRVGQLPDPEGVDGGGE